MIKTQNKNKQKNKRVLGITNAQFTPWTTPPVQFSASTILKRMKFHAKE